MGRTGWPLVDACVAMLRETGWINFRMRAMLVSVAAYPLWLHWRRSACGWRAQFLDYEPGIHWSQLQMQSGTTGINTTRRVQPDQAGARPRPQGVFVRRWLPALWRVPDTWLFEPWRMPESVQARAAWRVGEDIALPPVDLETATRAAKTRIHALRAQPEVRAAKAAIVERHGSRKPPGRRKTSAGRRVGTAGPGVWGQAMGMRRKGDLPTKPCAGVGGRSRGGRSGRGVGRGALLLGALPAGKHG